MTHGWRKQAWLFGVWFTSGETSKKQQPLKEEKKGKQSPWGPSCLLWSMFPHCRPRDERPRAVLMWGPRAPSKAAMRWLTAAETVNPGLLYTHMTADYKPIARGFFQFNFITFLMKIGTWNRMRGKCREPLELCAVQRHISCGFLSNDVLSDRFGFAKRFNLYKEKW